MSDQASGAERPPGPRLESWKEIAAYLRRDVRTVQRWELREGLPVHRLHHADRSTIYAFGAELDAWVAERDPGAVSHQERRPPEEGLAPPAVGNRPRAASGRRRGWLVGLGVAAVAGLAVWWAVGGVRPQPPPRDTLPPVTRVLANLTREDANPIRVATGATLNDAVLSTDERTLYVSAARSDAVLVFDTVRQRVVREIPVPGRPGSSAVSADGEWVYVARDVGKVTVIRTRDQSTTEIETGGPVADLLATADGRFVYFALQYGGLVRLDTATRRLERIPVVGCPMALAADRDRLFVSFQCQGPGGMPGHDSIGAFDLRTGRPLGHAQGPPQVGGSLAISPDGTFLWVNGRDACIAGEYDHAGCPEVPAGVVNAFSTSDFSLLRSVALGTTDTVGALRVLPGGLRAFAGGVVARTVDTGNFAIAEALAVPISGKVPMTADHRRAWLLLGQEIVGVEALTTACDLPAGGLLHHWPGDGATQDVRAALGTEHATATFGPGVVGQAFVFDGAGAEVRTNTRRPVQWSFSDATLMAWVKFREVAGEMPLVDRSGPPGSGVDGWRLVKSADNRFAFCAGPEAACHPASPTHTLFSVTRAQPGRWFHIAVTRQPGATRLYVNGRVEAEQGELRFSESRPDRFHTIFGSDERGHHLGGLLDELAVYSRALDASEIARVYANALAPACRGDLPPNK